MEKKRENSPEKWRDLRLNVHKHTETWDISAITNAFLDQKRVNVCEHMVKWHHMSVYERCYHGVARQEAGTGGGLEGKLSGDYLRFMPGLCLEDRTNWYASSRWWQVMWLVLGGKFWRTHTFQQELKGSWWDYVWTATRKGKLSGLLEEDRWPFILVDILFLVSPILKDL